MGNIQPVWTSSYGRYGSKKQAEGRAKASRYRITQFKPADRNMKRALSKDRSQQISWGPGKFIGCFTDWQDTRHPGNSFSFLTQGEKTARWRNSQAWRDAHQLASFHETYNGRTWGTTPVATRKSDTLVLWPLDMAGKFNYDALYENKMPKTEVSKAKQKKY